MCKSFRRDSYFVELKKAFTKAEDVRANASSQAINSVGDASMKVMKLIEKNVEEATNADHTGTSLFRISY